jgi:peroxiredoxin
VYGVNPSSETSHLRFARKHSFPFPLIVDKGARIARAYRSSLWLLVRRTVYVIAPGGAVLFARRGKPSPAELLAQIKG